MDFGIGFRRNKRKMKIIKCYKRQEAVESHGSEGRQRIKKKKQSINEGFFMKNKVSAFILDWILNIFLKDK